jgi:hypothetical protein
VRPCGRYTTWNCEASGSEDDAQPAVEPERPTALPLGTRRASRAGARLTASRYAARGRAPGNRGSGP